MSHHSSINGHKHEALRAAATVVLEDERARKLSQVDAMTCLLQLRVPHLQINKKCY